MQANIPKIQQIMIYLEGYESIIQVLYIKNVLRKLFSVQVVQFCESMDHSDVIITKDILTCEKSQNIFCMDDVLNDAKWEELISYLINKVINKQDAIN
ncbi:hypothetical protein [Lactococcus petauri]|uniref:hypothetical protein n=1 Tax=Lactococcus petauri TaxID=1940789 RepID=UPI00254C4850|nr:hypothetical protein [Lactococcus petauri]